jgi:hypothetical protein
MAFTCLFPDYGYTDTGTVAGQFWLYRYKMKKKQNVEIQPVRNEKGN